MMTRVENPDRRATSRQSIAPTTRRKGLTNGNNLGIGLDNASENAAARDADIFAGAIGSAKPAMLEVMVANAQRRALDGTESITDWWAGQARKEEWLVPDCR